MFSNPGLTATQQGGITRPLPGSQPCGCATKSETDKEETKSYGYNSLDNRSATRHFGYLRNLAQADPLGSRPHRRWLPRWSRWSEHLYLTRSTSTAALLPTLAWGAAIPGLMQEEATLELAWNSQRLTLKPARLTTYGF